MTTPTAAKRIGVYAGSFDPPTHGHLDIIWRALAVCDHLYVAVAINVNKTPLFTADERVAQLQEMFDGVAHVEICTMTGLLSDFARGVNATVNVRGLRSVADFESEMPMALMNRELNPELQTVFLPASVERAHISSSLIREIARFGGDVSRFVHPSVARALAERFQTKD